MKSQKIVLNNDKTLLNLESDNLISIKGDCGAIIT